MKVYIAIELFHYEGESIISVHSAEAAAEVAKDEAKKEDNSNGYNEYRVEEWEVLETTDATYTISEETIEVDQGLKYKPLGFSLWAPTVSVSKEEYSKMYPPLDEE